MDGDKFSGPARDSHDYWGNLFHPHREQGLKLDSSALKQASATAARKELLWLLGIELPSSDLWASS